MALMDFSLNDVGSVFTDIREAITGKKIEDPANLLNKVSRLESAVVEARGKVVEAEAKSEHWIVASWRPIAMLTFIFIIANNYIFVPYAQALFGVIIPSLEIPPDMWNLIQLGLTGYIVSRGAEKVMKTYKGNK